MIVAKIDVSKIDKSALFKGQKGTYLDLLLFENKDGEDNYGNHYMVVQGLPKERKDNGERGEILGNARIVGQSKKPPSPPREPDFDEDEDEDLPF